MNKIACLHCDLLINPVDIDYGQRAVCPRCGQVIYLDQRAFSTSLALLYTALLIYFPAVLLPFLSLEMAGQTQQVSVVGSIANIIDRELYLLAFSVFALVIFFPLVKMIGLLLVISPLAKHQLPPLSLPAIRLLLKTAPWNMVEVYLVGALVTLVKLKSVAIINYAEGFIAFVALILVNAAINLHLPQKRIWQSIASLNTDRRNLSPTRPDKQTTQENVHGTE